MTSLKHTLIFALLFLFAEQLNATHIVGGGITYECIGSSGNNRTYRFTMKVYRDCLNGQAEFDNPANIAIYVGSFLSSTQFASFTVPRGPVVNININQPDCINNLPIICLQEATYTWERTLPVSTLSYFVEYQRCCRTNAIANIVNPANTGATYYVEITSAAQTLCNSSPVFNNFPPVVICNNYPVEEDYSATDPDGDVLVYSFCAPFSGGSQGGGGCNSPQPNPPCPPPYNLVNFIGPAYSATQPMGGNPVIKINANSGVISGTPTLNGQFVVGVCVEEYRNGVLLSVTRRDFQFNVAPCAPQVSAQIEYDDIAGLQQYVIKSCNGDTSLTIVNQSIGGATITDFEWSFDMNNGNTLTNTADYNLTVDFPDYGTYNGTLILNKGLDCGDTAFIQVKLYPAVKVDFGPDIKICKDSTVTLDAGAGFTSYEWQNGATTQTLSVNTSGVYYVAAADSCGDIHSDSIQVTISPVPDVNLADAGLCPGKSITLDVPGFVDYTWLPSAGLSCGDCQSVTIQPGSSATYTFLGINQDGCSQMDTFDITVLPTPMQTYTIQFYPNQSVTLGGQTYTQPGTVMLDVASTTGGCDSINTYKLELLPTTLDIQCPANITVAIPGSANSTTAAYALPTVTTDCPGATPTPQLTQGLASGGTFPAGVNTVCYAATNTCGDSKSCCFTVTATTLSIQCPPNQSLQLPVAATTITANYAAPTTNGNCPSPATLTLQQGLASGSGFPLGLNTVCYQASNACGNMNTCCFTISVQAAPSACDIKTIGCMRYELLDIRLDSISRPRYRFRVTNFCPTEMSFVAIQLPNGMVAAAPAEASIYTAPNTGNKYTVRNPNFSPFYSVRYWTVATGLKNGESDVFELKLPPQIQPWYFHIGARIKDGTFHAAHLNTFYCPVQPWTGSKMAELGVRSAEIGVWNDDAKINLRPNPTDGVLFLDMTAWQGQVVQVQVINAQGQLVSNRQYNIESELLEMNLDATLANGLYYLVLRPVNGKVTTAKFVLAR